MFKAVFDWLIPGHQQKRICCFHFGRCGSTLLGNMLNGHSQLDWRSEIFHRLHEESRSTTKQADGLEILDFVLADCQKQHIGIETKFQHIDANGLNFELTDFVAVLREAGFSKFMVLRRSNYLRQAISVARGQRTKTWHVSSSGKLPDNSPFEFDINEVSLGGINRPLLNCFAFLDDTYERATNLFQAQNLDVLQLDYESDLERDALVGFEKTIEFLGLRKESPKASLRKLEQRPISDIVSNFDEIKKTLSDTQYAWMCESS